VGRFTSITIGADGLGLISYYDDTKDLIKIAHCSNTNCTTATITQPNKSSGSDREYASITIGADGLGLISYHWEKTGLNVARCSDINCTTATITTVPNPFKTQVSSPPTTNVGRYSSITIGTDGLGLISYYDDGFADLRVAHCSDTNCTTATITTLDSTGDVGRFTSITIGADGLGLISYIDTTKDTVKVAHCSNTDCTAATTATLDSIAFTNVASSTSMTIGADGLGLISYYDAMNQNLKVAHCANTFCSPYFRRR
jgi:preprotein translocase subunit Sec61beta